MLLRVVEPGMRTVTVIELLLPTLTEPEPFVSEMAIWPLF
jgi:hypothetical protein